jgi:hypothetical protein
MNVEWSVVEPTWHMNQEPVLWILNYFIPVPDPDLSNLFKAGSGFSVEKIAIFVFQQDFSM